MSKKCCDEEDSRCWIDYPEDNNCIYTKRLGVSLVRVSQIEKQALKKLSKRIKK